MILSQKQGSSKDSGVLQSCEEYSNGEYTFEGRGKIPSDI